MNNKWNKIKYQEYLNSLLNLQDINYLKFTAPITNTPLKIIGIRIPKLKLIAKTISKGEIESFIKFYRGNYFEECMILGLVIAFSNREQIINKYLLFFASEIKDWSVCDSVANSLKIIGKNQNQYFLYVVKLLQSSKEFEIRFGLVILLNHYLNEEYIDYIINKCINLKSESYYVNMALSWLLCECYIKYPAKTDQYISKKYLNKFVLNKTISKINDSYRVSIDNKKSIKKRKI